MSIFMFAYGLIQLLECGLCGGKQMATNNIDENSVCRQCVLQLIMRYSTSGEQYLGTSLILDIAHQQLLTNRHISPPLALPDVAALSCRNTEKPASSILSVSSFSQVLVKHKILPFLMSNYQDSLDRRSSYKAPGPPPPFPPSFLHADDGDLGLVLRKQYIYHVGLIKEKNLCPV